MPVYDLQIANIIQNFPDAEVLDEDFFVDALGQASIRYVLKTSHVLPCNHLFQDRGDT